MTQNILQKINSSDKSYIIYKSKKGFDLYTEFTEKKILSLKNTVQFLNKFNKKKIKLKKTDLYIGFFGYELLNNLIGVKIRKQSSNNFPKGIFYKPSKIINLNEKLIDFNKTKTNYSKFKININLKTYRKIFENFKKKIKKGETYQIKICTKYKRIFK